MAIFRLIRPINLLMIAFAQWLGKYALFETSGIELTLNTSQFVLLVAATLCIAAGGNVINDILDIDIDKINKPDRLIVGKKVSEKTAFQLYILLTTLGVLFGFVLANKIDHPGMAIVFIITAALLYLYASQLKAILVVGNVLISFLVALSLIILILFDIFPAISDEEMNGQVRVSKLLMCYALFAFYLTLIREIVKDIQDMNGDKNGGMNTLAIVLGRKRSTSIVFIMAVIGVIAIVYYMYMFLYDTEWLMLYFLLAVLAPLLFFCAKAWVAESKKDYAFLSLLLKGIQFLGLCSLLFYFSETL